MNWRLRGQSGGKPTELWLEAKSRESVARFAQKNAITVDSIDDAPAAAASFYDLDHPEPSPVFVGASDAFWFGFYAALGAIVALLLIGAVVGVVVLIVTLAAHLR